MKILDFSNARRAYLLSSNIDADYKYYLHSGRKEYFKENGREVKFIEAYCPQIKNNRINRDELNTFNPDKIVVTSVSMNFKEYEKSAMGYINKYGKHVVAVDYAWDAARKYSKKKSKRFKHGFDNIAVAVEHPKFWSYSQPELDMYAQAKNFTTSDQVIAKYNLPKRKKYIVVTSHAKYRLLGKLAGLLKSFGDSYFIIWKLKFKQKEYAKKVKKALRSNRLNFMIIAGPKEKSHTAFLSPLCELSLVVDLHINMVPISFSQVEMSRAGVPTYIYDEKNGLHMPGRIRSIVNEFWHPDSVKLYSKKFIPSREFCKVKIDDLFCTKNFIKRISD